MRLTVLAAQFPVSLSIQRNLRAIRGVLQMARPGDWVIFPEGSVSGYSPDHIFLHQGDEGELQAALNEIETESNSRGIYVWAGAYYRQGDRWFNTAWGFGPDGVRRAYRKINLATSERGILSAGDDLPVFDIATPQGTVTAGVQICRELRYPEQWSWLARQGAQIFLHLNNAVGGPAYQPVWRSHLISRAAETQRFVVSVNAAAPDQTSPTLIVSPKGWVLAEMVSDQPGVLKATLDLDEVSDVYLGQCRTDVIDLTGR